MMEKHDRNPRLWMILLGSLAIALVGSCWAAFASAGCRSCEGIKLLFGSQDLGIIGVIFYILLLAVALFLGRSVVLFGGIQVAAGVHAGLVAYMVHKGMVCPACILTALGAFAALGVSLRVEPYNLYRAGFILPIGALVVQIWLFMSGGVSLPEEVRDQATKVVQTELAGSPAASGRVRMVAFTRPDCGYCWELENEVIPELKSQFGDRLRIERRSAESIPGLPTPTLILIGASSRNVIPGLPHTEVLVSEIKNLLGEHHGAEALLPESR